MSKSTSAGRKYFGEMDYSVPQMDYIERCLASQRIDFTRFGMYEDPNCPLAYDAFPRLWLEDALAPTGV